MGFHIAAAIASPSSLLWKIRLPPASERTGHNLQTALCSIAFLAFSLEMLISSFGGDSLQALTQRT